MPFREGLSSSLHTVRHSALLGSLPMPLPPKIDYSGQKATLTVTEFRSAPGDALDRVSRGMEITVTKNGRPVAVLSPPETVIDRSGKLTGRKPLTFGLDLGSEYALCTEITRQMLI